MWVIKALRKYPLFFFFYFRFSAYHCPFKTAKRINMCSFHKSEPFRFRGPWKRRHTQRTDSWLLSLVHMLLSAITLVLTRCIPLCRFHRSTLIIRASIGLQYRTLEGHFQINLKLVLD